MSREKRRRVARALLAVILLSLAAMALADFIYTTKGLDRLKPVDEYSGEYYRTM